MSVLKELEGSMSAGWNIFVGLVGVGFCHFLCSYLEGGAKGFGEPQACAPNTSLGPLKIGQRMKSLRR